jgi:polysaccharide biosynthesis transport protein
VVVSTLSESPTYQNLLNRLKELEAKIALESARLQDGAPAMQELLDQRRRLLPLIEAEAQRIAKQNNLSSRGNLGFQGSLGRSMGQQLVEAANRVQTLQAQAQAMSRAELQLRQQTKDFAGIARSYDAVQRNLKIAAESLNRLLVARENLQLELTRQTMPWQQISTINDDSIKDASGRLRQFLLAGVASTLLALSVAWLMEKLDPSFHDVDDLTDELKLTCLGVIPFDPRKKRAKQPQLAAASGELALPEPAPAKERTGYYTTSPFTEAFYSLYTNIRLMGTDNPIQVLTIVSTSPGDGKTTVSSNLAIAAAALGQRVLLVDVDMRYPRLHQAFEVINARGLSNILTGEGINSLKFTDICIPYEEDDNLQLLTAGPQPPDPPRLLSSNRIRTLVEEMRKEFDLIIFDTPPLGHFVDAKLLSTLSDGTVMVVSVNKTDRAKAKQVIYDLTSSISTPVLGCVVNGVKQTQKASDYYYYANQAQKTKEQKQLSSV